MIRYKQPFIPAASGRIQLMQPVQLDSGFIEIRPVFADVDLPNVHSCDTVAMVAAGRPLDDVRSTVISPTPINPFNDEV